MIKRFGRPADEYQRPSLPSLQKLKKIKISIEIEKKLLYNK